MHDILSNSSGRSRSWPNFLDAIGPRPAVPGRVLAIHGRTRLYLLGYCRTGLPLLVLGSWYYFYMSYTIQRSEPSSTRWPQTAAAVMNKYRPGRGRPGPKQAGRTRPNSRPAAACGRLRLTATDVMHCWTVNICYYYVCTGVLLCTPSNMYSEYYVLRAFHL